MAGGAQGCCVHVFGEYKPIRSHLRLRIYLTSGGDAASSKSARLSATTGSDGLIVSWENGRKTFLLENLQLPDASLPPFCQGQVEATLQTSRQEWLCVPSTEESGSGSQDALVQRVQRAQCHWSCATCGQGLLHSDRTFQRVLPLPSDLWAEQSQDWFCHPPEGVGKDSASQGGAAPPKPLLTPRPQDCLVSSLHLLLPLALLLPQAIHLCGSHIHCRQCQAFLGVSETHRDGTEEDTAARMYTYAVRLHDESHPQTEGMELEDADRWRPTRLERFLRDFLLEQSLLYTSFRFLLQPSGPGADQSAVLVWLMDQNLVVFSTLTELCDGEAVEVLPQRPAIQLLYLTASQCEGGAEAWSKLHAQWLTDNAVQLVTMATPLCHLVAATLDSGNDRLSETRRQANGFRVSVLQGDCHADEKG